MTTLDSRGMAITSWFTGSSEQWQLPASEQGRKQQHSKRQIQDCKIRPVAPNLHWGRPPGNPSQSPASFLETHTLKWFLRKWFSRSTGSPRIFRDSQGDFAQILPNFEEKKVVLEPPVNSISNDVLMFHVFPILVSNNQAKEKHNTS